jgi:hypothetical protein
MVTTRAKPKEEDEQPKEKCKKKPPETVEETQRATESSVASRAGHAVTEGQHEEPVGEVIKSTSNTIASAARLEPGADNAW